MSIYMSSGYVLKCKYIIIKYDHKYCLEVFGLGQASPFKTQLKYLWRPQGGSHKRFGKSQLWSKSLQKKKKRTVPLNTVVCLPTASFSTCVPEFVLVVQLLSEVRAVCVCAGVCVVFMSVFSTPWALNKLTELPSMPSLLTDFCTVSVP